MTATAFPSAELQRLAPLRARLAVVFGVDAEAVLPVRGFSHAAEIAAREGAARELDDERMIEQLERRSRAPAAAAGEGLVYREIGAAYGAETPLCGALIGAPSLIERLSAAVGGDYLHPLLCAEALKALAPSRLVVLEARWGAHRAERARVIEKLRQAPGVTRIVEGEEGSLMIDCAGPAEVLARGARLACGLMQSDSGAILADIGDAASNDRLLAAFGVPPARAPRVAEAVRETKETKIAVRVDLDRAGAVSIRTGAGYFDHMLEQIAAHGGISLTLACEGDLHVDLHHTIEDCALALGQALSQALGERRGIARYGFTLPMDEAEARVSIDLGGRPYAVFEGAFAAPLIGEYPTEMTAHVFRSLAQTLGAAIHVSVRGENDHHKTEACFKAFARALRAAIAIEGDAVPSTKGMIG